MNTVKFKLRGKVWIYPGKAAWHFVNVNKTITKELKELFGGNTGGFGSIPVQVTVGLTKWKTSVFPDNKNGVYLLPIKKEVRKAENIKANKQLNFTLEVED